MNHWRKDFERTTQPLLTEGLADEQRAILIAYDVLWQARERLSDVDDEVLQKDMEACLTTLGQIIEHHFPLRKGSTRAEDWFGQVFTDPNQTNLF